jgi:hypothetical protein
MDKFHQPSMPPGDCSLKLGTEADVGRRTSVQVRRGAAHRRIQCPLSDGKVTVLLRNGEAKTRGSTRQESQRGEPDTD